MTDYLSKVAKRHNQWLLLAKYFHNNSSIDYEDLVQESYLILDAHLKKYGVTNENTIDSLMSFILRTVLNNSKQYYKINNQSNKNVEFDNNIEIKEEDFVESDFDFSHLQEITDLMNERLKDKEKWFDAQLFILHFGLNDGLKKIPMRKLAKETKLGLMTIFHSINETRKELREKFK